MFFALTRHKTVLKTPASPEQHLRVTWELASGLVLSLLQIKLFLFLLLTVYYLHCHLLVTQGPGLIATRNPGCTRICRAPGSAPGSEALTSR